MTWGRFTFMNVTVAFNGSRNDSVRDVIVEFGEGGACTILRIPETEINTIARYRSWALAHDVFGKAVIDAVWHFCRRAYGF